MEDDLGDLSKIGELTKQIIPDIQIPISHDAPKTTLESLTQLKNEFSQRLQQSEGDSSKKRRYQRQIKQLEDAIKSTKENKAFNYAEIIIPPGFAPIPLQKDGRPILTAQSTAQSTSTSVSRSSSNVKVSKEEKRVEKEEEIDEDDLIDQLEKEIDDHDLGDEPLDPEEERFNKQINAAKKFIPNLDGFMPKDTHNIEDQLEAMMISEPGAGGKNRKSKQPGTLNLPNFEDHSDKLPPNATTQKNPSPKPKPASINSNKSKEQNKELSILLERQHLFKEAALTAKKNGNVDVALVYLRHSKGFDAMINAAENGLPVDMSNLPIPPQLEGKTKQTLSPTSIVGAGSTRPMKTLATPPKTVKLDEEPIPGDRKAVFKRLQEDLVEQIKMATATYKHFQNMGDITNANKFNQMARESVQDLDALKSSFAHGESVPLYHYEKRAYQTVDSNSDLTDNDLELLVVRAINLPLPKDMDAKSFTTYVKFEFPYPPEQSQSDKTSKVSGSLNPEYNQTFKLQIQRKQTKFVRMMNRKELKLEIFYRAGLFKSDKQLGVCNVKLQPLETSSTIHDAFDLLEGRKQTGAKIEIKVRIREPLLRKEVKEFEYRWLVIDKFSSPSNQTVSI